MSLIISLIVMTLMQVVLGIDNLLYIILEVKNAPENKRKFIRQLAIVIAIALRIVILFAMLALIKLVSGELFSLQITDVLEGHFTIHSLIVFFGGAFIIYTAIKEIWHILSVQNLDEETDSPKSLKSVWAMIIFSNIIFSFDSVLSAMALSDNIWLMNIAIILGGILMMWVSGGVSTFIQKHRKFEVLGLFILFLVGLLLLSEACHLSHLKILGNEIVLISESTFYFLLVVVILIDIIQTRYQAKLLKNSKQKNEEKK